MDIIIFYYFNGKLPLICKFFKKMFHFWEYRVKKVIKYNINEPMLLDIYNSVNKSLMYFLNFPEIRAVNVWVK